MSESKNLIANKAKSLILMLDKQEQEIMEAYISDRIERATSIKKFFKEQVSQWFLVIAVITCLVFVLLFVQDCAEVQNIETGEKYAACKAELIEHEKALELIANAGRNSE